MSKFMQNIRTKKVLKWYGLTVDEWPGKKSEWQTNKQKEKSSEKPNFDEMPAEKNVYSTYLNSWWRCGNNAQSKTNEDTKKAPTAYDYGNNAISELLNLSDIFR